MTVIALCSAHGAPGVTTAALALLWAWPAARPARRALLVDADAAGSGLLPGVLLDADLTSCGAPLLMADRTTASPEALIAHAVGLDPQGLRMVLPGVSDPRQARPLVQGWPTWLDVARELSDRGVDVLVDVGRLGHRWEPTAWLTGADVVAVAVRPVLASIAPAAGAVRTLRLERPEQLPPVALLIDEGGYPPSEVATALPVGELLTLPHDSASARALLAGEIASRRIERAALVRGARAAVDRLGVIAPDRTEVAS